MELSRLPGTLIVLEGVDGAGTTTQSKRLQEFLKQEGHNTFLTCEPSQSPVGKLIRQILTQQTVLQTQELHESNNSIPDHSWKTLALLFAADRMEHVYGEIIPRLQEGCIVICDRYDYSSIAYQGIAAGQAPKALQWLIEINRFALRPHLTFVLNTSLEMATARREQRGEQDEIFDKSTFQKKLITFYRDTHIHFPNDTIEYIDANLPLDEVFTEVKNWTLQYLKGV